MAYRTLDVPSLASAAASAPFGMRPRTGLDAAKIALPAAPWTCQALLRPQHQQLLGCGHGRDSMLKIALPAAPWTCQASLRPQHQQLLGCGLHLGRASVSPRPWKLTMPSGRLGHSSQHTLSAQVRDAARYKYLTSRRAPQQHTLSAQVRAATRYKYLNSSHAPQQQIKIYCVINRDRVTSRGHAVGRQPIMTSHGLWLPRFSPKVLSRSLTIATTVDHNNKRPYRCTATATLSVVATQQQLSRGTVTAAPSHWTSLEVVMAFTPSTPESTTADHDARLEAVATSLEDLARNLRRLKLAPTPRSSSTARATPEPSMPPAMPPSKPSKPSAGFSIGQRVRVIVAGPYKGRTGEILGPRGRMFWNIRLDATTHQAQCDIWKMPSSLLALPAGL
jgi:hypothetical protein